MVNANVNGVKIKVGTEIGNQSRYQLEEPMASVIKIPQELARELDRLAVAQHKPRTAYVVDILWRDVRRNKQHEALQLSAGAWNPADHPELAQGGTAYVEQIRSEPDERFEDAIRQNR